MRKVNIEPSWYEFLEDQRDQPYFQEITDRIRQDISA